MYVTSEDNTHSKELESANENFSLFRSFHRLDDENYSTAEAVLKGDYYFSRFSLDLIPVDSVEITDRFSAILRAEASGYESPEIEPNLIVPPTFKKGKELLEEQLEKICFTQNEPMRQDLERVILSGGKRLRPAFSQAAYELSDNAPHPILPLMVMIELMHTASLIHDDVVDKGQMRRGVSTINATSGDKSAVRAADFVLGRAMELLKIYKGTGINEKLAAISEQMCLGELWQLDNLGRAISEEEYMELIKKKTALFIEGAAYCGALAGGAADEDVKAVSEYGYNIGMAFQIKDDILDLTGGKKIGKKTGQDEEKGLMTLPKIIGLEAAEERSKEFTDNAVRAIEKIKDGRSKKAFIEMAKQLKNREI